MHRFGRKSAVLFLLAGSGLPLQAGTLDIGTGYDSVARVPKANCIANIETTLLEPNSASAGSLDRNKWDQWRKAFDGTENFSEQFYEDQVALVAGSQVDIRNGLVRMRTNAVPVLTDEAKALMADPSAFFAKCGDSFVSENALGLSYGYSVVVGTFFLGRSAEFRVKKIDGKHRLIAPEGMTAEQSQFYSVNVNTVALTGASGIPQFRSWGCFVSDPDECMALLDAQADNFADINAVIQAEGYFKADFKLSRYDSYFSDLQQ